MKKKHLRCLLVLLVAVCMVCSIAVPVCAEVLPSAQIGTPETALESDTEKDNTPTPTPTDTPTPEPAPSKAPSTPETSEPAATSETAAPAAPSLDEITTMLYSDLPDAPTGYYIGEYGLPVGTGQTKISLSAWQDELLDESSQGRLDADALNTDTSAMAVAKQPGQDYAIVPIVMQVEYPANGSATTVTLPDDVDLLSYASTEDHLVTASEEERAQILTGSYTDASASATGFYVKAGEDFTVEMTYTAPDGTSMSKSLTVVIDDTATAAAALPQGNSTSAYASTSAPPPPFTTGKITKIEYVVSTWLIWFNGVEAYCCSHGLNGQPNGCPTYNFAYVSKLEPGQYTPGNHYANQINIWGGLNQLSLGVLTEKHDSTTFSGSEFAANLPSLYSAAGTDTLGKAYQYYDDTQLWIIEHYPDSVAAQLYLSSIAAMDKDGDTAAPYVSGRGYYTNIYQPPAGYRWQIVAVVGEEIPDESSGSGEIPDAPDAEYYSANWSAPPQSASGSFDYTYTINIDKSANITHEKLDDAIFQLTPKPSSGTIDGGTWTISDPQIVTTVDGAATATWTLHYSVSKTSTSSLSGQEGPYASQEEADAAAEAAKNNAITQLQNEAQNAVNAALAAARAQLANFGFEWQETTVPHGFDPTDSSSGSISVPANGSATAVVKNQPWQAHVTWEKRDALTGGRITEDAEYAIYEWSVAANGYQISPNYRVTRLENGLYTVTVTNPAYTDWTEGYVYYTQDNLGKFRIEELTSPAGYTDAALQDGNWVEHWSQEFEITESDQTVSYTGGDADYNRPQGNKVIIKKIEAHTGEIIEDDAVFTLYQWNQARGLYEVSKDYAFTRDAEGLYTITSLHDDWTNYVEGNLYYEDTLCDVREDTVNSDGTISEHPIYYTDHEPVNFPIEDRAVTNDGQFVVVESRSPYGYYGDWTGSRETPNFEIEDAGKHAYYIRLNDDGSTITLTDGAYNAHVLTENKGGTLIELSDGSVVTLDVFSPAPEEYDENNLFRNYPWYSTVVWEKRDALTGGLVDADTEFEIQEWNPEKGQYEKSTYYQVVRRDDGKYTVHLIGDAFFPGWEGKQGYVYYHQANEGKYRLVELTSPAGYTDAALQDGNWGEHWSQEFEVNDGHLTFSYTGKDADYNQPKGNRLVIKKIEAHTGEIIEDDAVFTLYQWNQARGLYEVSKDYAFVRDAEGLYTITSLHDDWAQYEEGNLYYEDTLCDVREDTVNSDGVTTEHPQYYTDYEPVNFPIDDRAVTTDGQFVVVESKSPYGYYGDWTGDEDRTNYEAEDAGKRAYYIRLTDDGSTITIGNGNYNANVLTENQGGTLIDLGDKVVSLEVFGEAATEYPEDALYKNNPWYSSLTWEKRDALTGGRITEDAEYEIQEWNPEKGQYEKSTHYRVVRRDDGLYTVNLIDGAFFPGWEGKQGYVYYHQSNEGKYRIVELRAPSSYNLKAWEHNNWVIGWSEEIVVHPDHPSYAFVGDTADYNMPYKTQVLIKKVDEDTGEFIQADTTWTLYEWNERNNQYEVSPNYKIIRRDDGYYTVTTLHSDWEHYEEGYLYFEDTQQDYPESYHRYSDRRFSNQGKFLIVESKAPAGYYGDYWRNDEPGTHSTDTGSDLGKRGYAFTLTEDNGTLWLTNADYNAKILYDVDDELGNATLVLADGRPTSVIIDEDKQPEYDRPETAFTNAAKYGYVEFDRSQYRKEWAQTGDEEYTVAYDATTDAPESASLAAPTQLRWQNGLLYRLSDYTATLISGPVEHQVETADITSLEAVPATVEYDVGGQPVQLQLVSATWIQQPQEKHTGYVDMGYSPTQPKFEETSTFTAEDGTEFVGHLVKVEQTGDYQWVSTEIPATYHGWPDVKGIYLGNLVLPHNDSAPVYQGYETDILDYLGLDPSTHRITGAAWTGSWQGQPGEDMMIRPAVFDLQVYAAGWVGVYEDDVEDQSGTALATYRLGEDENTDGLYHWRVTAHYHPMLSALQAAAAVLGVALLIVALIVMIFILSRKRKDAKKRKEVH
ncbi:MAG: hypothetical protein ACLTWO_02380 [Blautia massiliensis (ex Durand et al. 2017)]